jgi:hypothetical protein
MIAGDATAAAILDARNDLVAAIAAVGPAIAHVRAYAVSGPWEGRTAIVSTGSPFLERPAERVAPDSYRVRFGVLLIAGVFDVEAAAVALDDMTGHALAAIVNATPAWEPPRIGPARIVELSGGRYLTATVDVSRVLALC